MVFNNFRSTAPGVFTVRSSQTCEGKGRLVSSLGEGVRKGAGIWDEPNVTDE